MFFVFNETSNPGPLPLNINFLCKLFFVSKSTEIISVGGGFEPQSPRSWCEDYTDLTTKQSKRSVEYPVIFNAPLTPTGLGDIGKNARARV